MSTLPGTVTKIEFHPDDRFSASVQVEIPPNTSHYELDTEQFWHLAHAMPLTNPPPGATVMIVTGPTQNLLVEKLHIGAGSID